MMTIGNFTMEHSIKWKQGFFYTNFQVNQIDYKNEQRTF